jgi:hypothetical protein
MLPKMDRMVIFFGRLFLSLKNSNFYMRGKSGSLRLKYHMKHTCFGFRH